MRSWAIIASYFFFLFFFFEYTALMKRGKKTSLLENDVCIISERKENRHRTNT